MQDLRQSNYIVEEYDRIGRDSDRYRVYVR